MTPIQFVTRAVGLPWVRWRSDWSAVDCYGLVVLWYRHVLGIELGEVPKTDIAAGLANDPEWIECGPEAGATMFMGWRHGAPSHCGMLVDESTVLHAEGSADQPGSVRVSRLAAMRRLYPEIRFYRRRTKC